MKRVKQYKGFIIKETTEKERLKDDVLSRFYCFKDGFTEWYSDNLQEIIDFIDSY